MQWIRYVGKVIRATFIVCNKNLYQISAQWMKIKSQQILQIIMQETLFAHEIHATGTDSQVHLYLCTPSV